LERRELGRSGVHNLLAVERRLEALHRLKDEGKVGAVGVTHYSRLAFGDLMRVMRSGRVDFVQVPYNAAETSVTPDLLPLAEELGSVLSWHRLNNANSPKLFFRVVLSDGARQVRFERAIGHSSVER